MRRNGKQEFVTVAKVSTVSFEQAQGQARVVFAGAASECNQFVIQWTIMEALNEKRNLYVGRFAEVDVSGHEFAVLMWKS